MRLRDNDKWFRRLVGLSIIATAACQSVGQNRVVRTLTPEIPSRSACEKADAMWNEKIVPSRYEQLPPLATPGVFDVFRLLSSHFTVKALTTEGDELEVGRNKLIHAFGAEARLRLLIAPGASHFTGIFESGAECVIGRFSLATKPAADTSIPALALKIFISGDQPSLNLLLMHSVDGQVGHNFFAQDFSNILPPANSFSTRLLAGAFERSAVLFGAKDPNPGRLSLEHLSGMRLDGSRITAPMTPYQLIFRPTAQANALMRDATAEDDFRLKLAGLGIGQAIYDIYTLGEDSPAENAKFLGQLVLAAPLISSHYGDEALYFKHNMEKK